MMNRHFHAWLRAACALFCGAGILLLSACGGGNGAPNNPYAPPPPVIPPLLILPGTSTAYQGTPVALTVSGGVPPYRAFSSDQATLPVSQAVAGNTIVLAANNVTAPVSVSITVQDTAGTVSPAASVVVNPAPLFQGTVVVTGNFNPDCPDTANAVCSGSTGTATVKVLGNGGVGSANRQLRFDVVQGAYSIVSTNPAQPLVQTLTVVSDNQGNASVVLAVPADTPTQTGILRVTDVTSNNQITATFNILEMTVGGEVLSVLPQGTTTITGPDTAHCSSGVVLNYYIYGGKPPYTVQTNFTQQIAIGGSPVTKSGGTFTATTTGLCFENGTFVITDSAGRTIANGKYPLVTNKLGATPPVPPQTEFMVTPGAIAKASCVPANAFQFIVTGGATPYSAVVTSSTSSTSPTLSPQTGIAQGQAVAVSNITGPSDTVVTIFDNSSPRQSSTVTISCAGGATPPGPSSLTVAPLSYNFAQSTCVNQTANFVVSGGSPPYSVFFASPRPGAVIAPTSLPASGQGFSVTGLTDGVQTTNITVQDASAPVLQQIVTIACPTVPNNAPQLAVTPGSYTYTKPQPCDLAVSNFVVTGGTPPYNVAFSVPGTTGTIAPTTVALSGGGFSVTGLAANPIPRTTQIRIQDTSPNPLVTVATVICQ